MAKARSILVLAVVAAVAASACTASVLGADRSGNRLVVALAEAPDALDPTTSSTFVLRIVYANMCEKLFDVDEHLNIVPQLASALPQISFDGLTYTISLRPGIRFNDGSTLDAQAVKITLDRYKNLPESGRAAELGPLERVDVVDPQTVRLHLSKPFAPLSSILADRAGMILSPTQLRKLGDDFAKHPVCVGPLSFESRPSADEINLVKSPYYYDRDAVRLDGVVFRAVVDPNARVEAVKDGPDTRIVTQTSLGYQGLDFASATPTARSSRMAGPTTPLPSTRSCARRSSYPSTAR